MGKNEKGSRVPNYYIIVAEFSIISGFFVSFPNSNNEDRRYRRKNSNRPMKYSFEYIKNIINRSRKIYIVNV